MELSLAVNASLVALSKFGTSDLFSNGEYVPEWYIVAIFCTEPFRIPVAGRVDICCFDKTGTITAENLVLEGVVGIEWVLRRRAFYQICAHWFHSASDQLKLVDVKESGKQTTLCLAAAHALVRLDDGTIVGDPMEKTTLEALQWQISQGLHSL